MRKLVSLVSGELQEGQSFFNIPGDIFVFAQIEPAELVLRKLVSLVSGELQEGQSFFNIPGDILIFAQIKSAKLVLCKLVLCFCSFKKMLNRFWNIVF